jgi:thiol:disulfide interchange protein DsbC
MTDAKSGIELEFKDCDNPVKEHMELGELLGVSGTPAILLESGDMIPGYVPAKRLLGLLETKKH